MRLLKLEEVLSLHADVIRQSGGSSGIRNLDGVEAAVSAQKHSFGGEDLYPSLIDKAAAVGFVLIQNHPFVDGNKRIGHAALETLLVLNGHEITASTDEQEATILDVASGKYSREKFTEWLRNNTRER